MGRLNYSGKFDAMLPIDGTGAHSHGHLHVDSVSAHALHAPAGAIIVPDAQLLFNGDFKRSGVDLVLSNGDHELVLPDYFKGEKRAALSSPDGAHLTGDIINALTGHQQFAQADGSASVAKVIGHVSKLAGSATAIRNGVSIILNNGDDVQKGDVVQAGSNSTLGITFIDGTVFGLSSNAKMVLNEMVYDPNGSSNSSLISLVAGTISFVAGETAKHGDMKIDTPVATMGIRGTAVLVEIDFDVPQNGAPSAKFQVLVEPDGHTGNYVLFDKVTLAPIATVDQAGVVKSLSQGILTSYSAPLSADVQKLITDVFSLKFTDNTNPNTKSFDHFTDTLLPQAFTPIKLADGATAIPIIVNVNTTGTALSSGPGGPIDPHAHIPGPPLVVAVDGALIERIGVTHSSAIDTVTGTINFVDINAGDTPTVTTKFDSFTYQNAQHQDVTATLNALQLADIAKVEANLLLTPDPGNNNNGSVTWNYTVVDSAFDFLAAGETLTLTYVARVDNNFAPNDEAGLQKFTITITRGSNDVPVIVTGPQTVSFSGGTNIPGGDLPATAPTSGTLAFTDVDLTDTHTVSAKLTSAVLPGVVIPPGPLAAFEAALSASIAADSTGSGSGTINWKLADLPVFLADFIPKGETLTLTYTVTVTDSQNATATQNIIVTITGTAAPAVVWVATTAPGSPPGGLWSDAANWETGTVPTLNDDVIIITDQLKGLTPSFPVTIKAPAFAKSVTMNDFGSSAPELINQSTLTISGVLSLAADSIVDNSGTISVGGLMEVLNTSVLQNSGLITLASGGDFKDHSTISNTIAATIDVTGGTLNVQVDIANSGQVTVETNAKLKLGAAAIDGGTVTDNGEIDLTGNAVLKSGVLGNFGQIKVNGTGNALHKETVTANHALEILAGGALLLDLGTAVANAGGNVTVDSTATLTLDTATITGGTLNISGTLDSTGTSAITNVDITNFGLLEATGGVLTIDPAAIATLINSGTIEANGGELDIAGEPVINTGTLQAIDGGRLVLDGETVTNAVTNPITLVTSNGIVTVGASSTLDLKNANISGGNLSNSGTINNVSGSNVVSSVVTNTGTIEVKAGTLDLAGGLSGTGVLIIDAGATLELAGANAQTVTFAGGSDTLRLDNVLGFTGTIAGVSSTGGDFTITGQGSVTSTSGDAIDFTASGGVAGNTANVTLTPSGAITGAANGIVVIQNGVGDVTVDPSGNVVGQAGDGIIVEDSATGFGNIVVHDTGSVTGSGAGSVGLLADNLNAANRGNITITQLGGASGGSDGINAFTHGDGNVVVEAAGTITAKVQFGIRAASYGTGDISVVTDQGTVINAGGSGINAINLDSAIAASDDSTITVTAYGTINSGTTSNLDGSMPQGIVAGYYGTSSVVNGVSPIANINVNGTVVVNNYANITAAAGYGIDAYNYGNGDVTINDEVGTSVTGAQYGIAAFGLSHGTGNITVNVAANAAISGGSINGIQAVNFDVGDVTVSTSAGDVIHAGNIGINAIDEATSISAARSITVTANGTINAATGINAGYFPGSNTVAPNVAGNVTVDSNATIAASAGNGINAFNWGTGDVTVTETSSITAAGTGIGAFANDGGDVSVSVTPDDTVSGSTGVSAFTNHAGNVTITNDGQIAGIANVGINVGQDVAGSTGSTHVTNTGTVSGAANYAAIAIYEDAAGTATIDNSGVIGSSAVSASSFAIFEGGGDITINNTGEIYGNISLANATFNNESGGTWHLGGSSEFGVLAYTGVKTSTIDNAGTIDLTDSANLSGAHGLDIDNTGTIDNLSGTNTISAAITNSGRLEVTGGTLTIDAASSVTSTGTLEVNAGSLIIDSSLSGSAQIVGASFLELGASSSDAYSSAKIIFADKATGTLKLDHSESFTGTVSGLDDNTLDLGDITSGKNTTITYSGNSTGGILTIVNNADGSDIAHIKLTGNYLGSSFVATSDGNGGTSVTEVPGAIAGLDAHGNAIEGVAVTALITDGGQPVPNATYQWLLDGKDIADATGASYLPTENDEGHALTVNISFTDALHQVETSSASAGIVAESPTENATIALTGLNEAGNAVEGQQITATVTEEDAPSSGIIYTWMVNGQTVHTGTDAEGSSYTPTEADEGLPIGVAVSFTDIHGNAEHGAASVGIVAESPTENAAIALTGLNGSHNAVEGQQITATVIEADAPLSGIAYTWKVNGTTVHAGTDASGATYTPTEADEGLPISVAVSFTDTHGNAETGSTSAGTVAESPIENATILLTGLNGSHNAVQDQQITATVAEADAPPSGIVYTWKVNGITVHTGTDANGATYTPTEADEGKPISVAVSFTDTHGNAETGLTSAGTVQESVISDLVATLDSMIAKQGTTIHVTGVTDGGNSVSTGLSYTWQDSSDNGKHWSIVGNASSYTPGESDEGKVLQLVVTYTDAAGSESSTYNLGMPNDLTATLDRTTAEQGVTIHVTGMKDGGTPETRGVSYAWQVSSDGHNWVPVGTNSTSYTPVAADEGKALQVVVTYVDAGENESVTESVGTVAPAKAWNGGSNDWQTAGDWTSSGAPTSSNDAVVGANGTYTVKISTDAFAHSLILNDSGATVEIVGGHTLTLGGDLTDNAGSLQIDSNATLKDIAAHATMTGSLVDNGTIEAAGGTLEIAGNVTGEGNFKIDAGATLQLDHADGHDVVFAGPGELILKDPTHFTGTISRSGGSLDNGDVIDVAGFDATATVSYKGTTSGGTMTISESNHTVTLDVGANSTHWSPGVTDGHGGILIHDPPDGSGVAAGDSQGEALLGGANAGQAPAPPPTTVAATGIDQALTGTAGSDTFVFNFAGIGHDTVANFDPAHDVLQLGAWAFAKPQAILDVTQDDGHGNTVITPDAHDTITLSGVLKAQLSLADFHTV